jgi:cation:H+ antiporter
VEELLRSTLEGFPLIVLVGIAAFTLYTLSKGADILVDEAVALSVKWGVPKMIIGATIVSLGTTLPEAAVSVGAALQGNPDLALGNAVGSIICDTALIIGIASFIAPLHLDKTLTNKQGWLQFGAGLLLIAVSIPWLSMDMGFSRDGNISQFIGFGFVLLLIIYMVTSVKNVKKIDGLGELVEEIADQETSSSSIVMFKLVLGIALIIISSKILIPTVELGAVRIGIPQSVIAATLVAFGTSLPELVTAITAARKGHGELAIGNIIGADILNVLFVVGVSASVTGAGLVVPSSFFTFQFPVMMIALFVFRATTLFAKKAITRRHGAVLFGLYIIYLVVSFS